ncbi:MAG: hypothetical protein OEZ03_06695 [Alphaproteobacteria bacterium]|nr:hypothetical protein [Alphaproteobacteria bacterium]
MKWHDLAAVLALMAYHPAALAESTAPAEEIPCRDYGSAAEARQIAEKWIARKNSQYEEVVGGASWANDLWSISFPLLSSDKQGYASVTLLPGGEVVRCEATEECAVAKPPGKPACPASQKRIVTKAQAIEFATRFLEERAIPVNTGAQPYILSRPAWWVFVKLEPPMPGGHYTLQISADGEVIDTIPGE